MTDARTIAAALGLRRSGAVYGGACPACGYGGAFTVRDVDGRTLFRCHVGCEQVDVLDALRRSRAWGGDASPDRTRLPVRPAARGAPDAAKGSDASAAAERIWRASQPLAGTVAEAYLRRARGLDGLELPADLRSAPTLRHAPTGTAWPAMVAGVRDAAGRVVAVHRTFLRPDGGGKAPVAPAKMTLGPVGGCAVRLAPAGPHLIVGEGIESTLSAMLGGALPGWAALSAGGMRGLVLPPLPMAGTVTIAADRDPVGIAAAEEAARRWQAEGRAVRVAVPPRPHDDWNDALRAAEVAHDAA